MNRRDDPNPFEEEDVNPFAVIPPPPSPPLFLSVNCSSLVLLAALEVESSPCGAGVIWISLFLGFFGLLFPGEALPEAVVSVLRMFAGCSENAVVSVDL